MKNFKLIQLLSVILIALSFMYCAKSEKDIVRKNVESVVINKLNDPKSYEFVEIQLIDSFSNRDAIDYRIEQAESWLDYKKSRIDDLEKYKNDKGLSSLFKQDEYDKYLNEYSQDKAKIDELKELKKNKNDILDNIVSYTYSYSFRGNNALGAKILNTYYIQTDASEQRNIINIAENEKKIYLNPVDIEGYKEILNKYE